MRQPPGTCMVRVARSLTASVAAMSVVLAATGWLYLARPAISLPGPVIQDALPLDELSGHARLPLLLYLAVWFPAAVLLGLIARWARAERLTAALLLAIGVGGWTYLVNGMSILMVRQIPGDIAFTSAATEQAIFLPLALAGAGGALLARPRVSSRPRAPLVLSWLVAAVGLLGVLNAMLPTHRQPLFAAFAPEAAHGLGRGLVAPLSVALIFSAGRLARRQRRAWQVAVGLLAVLTVLHALRRFDEGALVAGFTTMALLARRGDFGFRGDPASKPKIALHATAAFVVVFGYGIVTLWINRVMTDRPFTLPFALQQVGRSAVGLKFVRADHLVGPFAGWYPISIFGLTVGAGGLLLFEWLAPWRYRMRAQARERELARAIVARWGCDTLAPFSLRADKDYFLSEAETAFVAYKVVGGVAVVAGDPIGPAAELPALLESFVDYAHSRGWRVTVLGASASHLPLYRAGGLRSLYHGDEAVVETESFSLAGRPVRKVRQSCHRLESAGYSERVVRPSELDDALREEFEAIARVWRGDAPVRGFTMALDALFRLGDDEALFVVGEGPDGRPKGFLHFAVIPVGSALSLSSMPRLPETPNGFNEWLIVRAIEWAREAGFERVSLNFTPFASLLAPGVELGLLQRTGRRALLTLKGHFQLDNLLQFNRKFFPSWNPRFVVYENPLDLPRVGIAALAAEAYLPSPGKVRTVI
jgi:lysyl-tRNA synthetase class 2